MQEALKKLKDEKQTRSLALKHALNKTKQVPKNSTKLTKQNNSLGKVQLKE